MPRRFFYDTEFIERPGYLDLISIGMVSEDGGREFYAVSTDFDQSQAVPWVRANVLPYLPWSEPDSPAWMSRRAIAASLLDFLQPSVENPVELWGCYPAFDHVALAWLYGPMVDLPPGMPKGTRCVKQLRDTLGVMELPPDPENAHHALADARWVREAWLFLRRVATLPEELRQWVMPRPPVVAPGATAVYYGDTQRGLSLAWSKTTDGVPLTWAIPWPFGSRSVTPAQLEALGFVRAEAPRTGPR